MFNIQTFCLTDNIFWNIYIYISFLSFDLASASAAMIYTNIHLRKLEGKISYFYEKQI